MKTIKIIILGSVILGTAALGASAYANRDGDRFHDRMIDKISTRLCTRVAEGFAADTKGPIDTPTPEGNIFYFLIV